LADPRYQWGAYMCALARLVIVHHTKNFEELPLKAEICLLETVRFRWVKMPLPNGQKKFWAK